MEKNNKKREKTYELQVLIKNVTKIIASFKIDFPKYPKIKKKLKYVDEIFYDKNDWKIEFYCSENFFEFRLKL